MALMDTLEVFRRWQRGEVPPIARLVGFRLIAFEPGIARFELDAGPEHANPMGSLHGGILCDLGDAAMGTATATTLKEGETFTTLELKINFLKPIWTARLVAEGRVIRRGRTIVLNECDITDGGGSLVAKLSGSCMILRGTDAVGR